MRSVVTKWSKVAVLIGVLLVVGLGTSMANIQYLHMRVTTDPVNPRLDEVTEIVVFVWEGLYAEVPELEVSFESPRGIQLVDGSSKITLALRGKEPKECRFKVKYVSSPAECRVKISYRKVGDGKGNVSVHQVDPDDPRGGVADGKGFTRYLYDKDKRFYTSNALQRLLNPDPAIVLQQELGLPDVGNEKSLWASVAFHLNKDIDEYSKIKKIRREAVIKLLKNKAETLKKERKISREQAYDVILRERLLWKDAGVPDPFDFKNRELYPDIWKGMNDQ